jgi:DNA-binding MurR/RpiR family transcriptional regulator
VARDRGSSEHADPFEQRVAAAQSSLSPTARRVVRFIDQNRVATLTRSAAELAASTGTSDATVIRTVQAPGFEGLSDLRQSLAASLDRRSTPADHMRRTLTETGENADRAITTVLKTHREAIGSVESAMARGQIAAAVSALQGVERIVVFGIGPSAALARYVSILLERIGRPARALDATGLALADQLLDLRSGDAPVGARL